jgi:hypothetical protein
LDGLKNLESLFIHQDQLKENLSIAVPKIWDQTNPRHDKEVLRVQVDKIHKLQVWRPLLDPADSQEVGALKG